MKEPEKILPPEEMIYCAQEVCWWEYGEKVLVGYTSDTLFLDEKNIPPGTTIKEVCWYVAYILGVHLTKIPGCSEKDSSEPKQITTETIQEFKKRTAYLLPQLSTVNIPKEEDAPLAA